jgi:L-histidine N-alpha-methyltransferase
MKTGASEVAVSARFRVSRFGDGVPAASLATDVRTGLRANPKLIPPKYFYDERGSYLYDLICEVPEYYPARTESALLEASARAIVEAARPDTIIELGSGTSRKTEHLLQACSELGHPVRYQPLDVCEEVVREAGARLLDNFEWLTIDGLVGDYGHGLEVLSYVAGRRLFVFLGGTLGNLTDLEAQRFLRQVRRAMGPSDLLLLGVDRVKDQEVLNAAYNDKQGVTAEFNLNVLRVINRELDASFDPAAFRHRAWFNEAESQIEMHLESQRAQLVRIDGLDLEVEFEQGETIRTEISRKFTVAALERLLGLAGLEIREHYEPENRYFSLVLLGPCNSATGRLSQISKA